jgi:hypothetical protein
MQRLALPHLMWRRHGKLCQAMWLIDYKEPGHQVITLKAAC